MDRRIEKMETKLDSSIQSVADKFDRTVREQGIICKLHNDRIDEHEKQLAITADRQEQADKAAKKRVGIVAMIVGTINVVIAFLFQRFLK